MSETTSNSALLGVLGVGEYLLHCDHCIRLWLPLLSFLPLSNRDGLLGLGPRPRLLSHHRLYFNPWGLLCPHRLGSGSPAFIAWAVAPLPLSPGHWAVAALPLSSGQGLHCLYRLGSGSPAFIAWAVALPCLYRLGSGSPLPLSPLGSGSPAFIAWAVALLPLSPGQWLPCLYRLGSGSPAFIAWAVALLPLSPGQWLSCLYRLGSGRSM
jgi:hypothetical protein